MESSWDLHGSRSPLDCSEQLAPTRSAVRHSPKLIDAAQVRNANLALRAERLPSIADVTPGLDAASIHLGVAFAPLGGSD